MTPPHRISAGALVVHDDRVLLVNHRLPGYEAFWVPPGGGVEGEETILDCAVRECFEETGLRVRPLRFAYFEEFFDSGRRIGKHWIHCELIDGSPVPHRQNSFSDEGLVDVRFCAQAEVATFNVHPRLMRDLFWQDLTAGFPTLRYIGFEP